MGIVGRRGYLGEISALCFLPNYNQNNNNNNDNNTSSSNSSLPYLLAGTGSELLVYKLESGELLKSFRVFNGIRVHGITSYNNNNNNHNNHNNNNNNNHNNNNNNNHNIHIDYTIAVYGERRVKLFKLIIIIGSVDLELIQLLPKFSHWVLDVSIFTTNTRTRRDALGGGENMFLLAIGCSDNSLHFWNSLTPQAITKVMSPDRCLLYSMRMWGDSVESLHIASGTIYNQIIVWKVVPYIDAIRDNVNLPGSLDDINMNSFDGQQYKAVHICRLAGHEGSIFRIAWSSNGKRLISVSDDRSARLWDIHWNMQELDNSGDILGSHSVGPVLFGHNARVWDCCLFDNVIVTAGEDCTCRVWGPDGNQLQMLKEHIGRGIWRCLYDPNSSLLVTAGFDSSIKVHKLHDSLFKASGSHFTEVKGLADRTIDFTVRIPRASEHVGLMNSKSEYVRCMRFARENILYVATNTGYLYLASLSEKTGEVKWTELVRVSEAAVAIVCMDLLSVNSPNSPIINEDWVACGDGKGYMTIVSIVINDDNTPKVDVTFTWSAGIERQLLGTYWCKSLGTGFIFTCDPRGTLRLWRLGDPLQPSSHNTTIRSDVSSVAKFVSCFGTRIMCLDVSFEQEVLVCGDLRGNLVLFPLFKHLLMGISSEPEKEVNILNHFKSAHGISSVCSISVASYNSSQVEILSTGGDGCICSLEYDRSTQILDFLGMKQVKELSLVQSVSSNDLTNGGFVIGFSSTNFLIWNLLTETKVAQVPCGGWRRPYSYYLGDVPEIQYCFAFVKDEIIYIRKFWANEIEKKIYPQNLHLQFHGREMHSISFISDDTLSNPNEVHSSKPCWIATGCEDGTVRLTGYDPSGGEWCASKLLGEHVGGSSVRSLCYVSTAHEFLSTNMPAAETTTATVMQQQVRENPPSLLISVGAKRVLTCWKQKNRATERTVAIKKQDETSSSMSFQWLSSDMPVKQCSTRTEGRERTANATEKEEVENDEYENDWRYLAVTAFLVNISYSRLTACFVVVACSDATLTLRALLLPYRLWFDIASLVSQTSPILALQHAVIPVSATSDVNVQTRSAYLVIGGTTDGNITFWDLTRSVEKFIQSLTAFQLQKSIDCQKRPRTGRGSQGGRWWKSSAQNVPSVNPNDSSISEEKTTDYTGVEIFKPLLKTGNGENNSSECIIQPLLVLNGVHQSGVNCLHMAAVKNVKGENSGDLYCVLSGGDDQAIHNLVFDLEMLPLLSQCTDYKKQEIVCDDVSTHGVTKNNNIHFGQSSNYCVRVCSRGIVASAHSSAVKGIWTDGTWVFSTGLDQRIRYWLVEEDGKLKEQSCLIISVPEPEALDARLCGRDRYQIVVAGRGMQMVDFST